MLSAAVLWTQPQLFSLPKFTPDSQIIFGSKIFHAITGKVVSQFPRPRPGNSCSITRNYRYLVLDERQTSNCVRAFEVTSGNQLVCLDVPNIHSAQISEDGRMLATFSGKKGNQVIQCWALPLARPIGWSIGLPFAAVALLIFGPFLTKKSKASNRLQQRKEFC